MSQFCTGVVVVSGLDPSAGGGQAIGFSAQSFVSVSLDPPLVSICPARSSQTWPRLREAGRFGINVLAADQHPVCATFARSGIDKFAQQPWSPSATGLPMLDGVLAYIECRLEAEHDAGDHTLVIGRVEELRVVDPERAPLLFFRGRYGAFDLLTATR
jgi:3-hydroxy-9,10-secoandrosta-1,3,5(10)-triene-9,17-dione monooxygenase reductase component